MQRRILFAAALAVAVLAVGLDGSQTESTERAIRLRFPEGAELTGLSIRYFIAGPFGGFGSFVHTKPDVREYALETWRGAQQATTCKAIIFCQGYRIVLLSQPALAGRRVGTVSVGLEPLGSVPLSGRIVSLPSNRDLTIEAVYLAYWGHEFFNIRDGAVASFTVARSKVAADGSFTLNVPDLARDPVVMGFDESRRGVYRLVGREMQTGHIYVLEEIQHAGRAVNIPVAQEYPPDLLLVATRR